MIQLVVFIICALIIGGITALFTRACFESVSMRH